MIQDSIYFARPKKFPYVIYYLIKVNTVRILAVVHGRPDVQSFLSRMEKKREK